MIEVLKILAHLVEHILHRDVHLLHNAFIDVPYYLLDYFELLEQFATSLQDILRKYVLLTIDPEIWKTFLGRVKYLCQVAQRSLFIQYLVSFRELFTILPRGTDGFEFLAEPFYLV